MVIHLPSLESRSGISYLPPTRNLFALAEVVVPTQATIDTHYAQTNPPVILRSDTAGDDIELMDVCMIPLMWVPYFVGGGTPKATLDKIGLMIASIAPVDRALHEGIAQWGRYACVAAGPFGAEVNNSSVGNSWRDFPISGVDYNLWAEARFQAVYRIAGPPPPPPAMAAASGDQHLRMAEAIVVGMKGATAAEKDKKEKSAVHEKVKILAACGLHEGEWDLVPPIYDKITEDGRTRSAVRAAMELEYRSMTMASEFPACVFLSTQLVTDVKELKFGWQGSTSFESCHRGISPFSVPSSSLEVHQRLRALEEDTELATTTTLAEIRATRTRPPTCPGDYYSLLQMLCSYIKLLMMMFGTACEHMTSATTIYFLLQERMSTFQMMTKEQVAHLLWAIFIDSRAFSIRRTT